MLVWLSMKSSSICLDKLQWTSVFFSPELLKKKKKLNCFIFFLRFFTFFVIDFAFVLRKSLILAWMVDEHIVAALLPSTPPIWTRDRSVAVENGQEVASVATGCHAGSRWRQQQRKWVPGRFLLRGRGRHMSQRRVAANMVPSNRKLVATATRWICSGLFLLRFMLNLSPLSHRLSDSLWGQSTRWAAAASCQTGRRTADGRTDGRMNRQTDRHG